MEPTHPPAGNCISIGIIAWNEERAIRTLLNSLFQQTLFAELSRSNLKCEILCLANGCSDKTVEVASSIFNEQSATHPYASVFTGRVINLAERGKINAWNQFVHGYSARSARFLFLMDADITIHTPDTLWNMVLTLMTNAEARVSVDVPHKDLEFKPRKSLREKISMAMSKLTRSASAQLCAQLYCIRAETARNIYLPKDLAACDDGFIKTLVCTDFLAHPVWPMRIQQARNAAHTFEAYTTLSSVFKNQKRQAIGQTIVHLLVDDHLKRLPAWERSKLADTLRRKEQENPDWLKRLVHEHVRRVRFFWRLYPGVVTYRFRKLAHMNWIQRGICFPAVLLGMMLSLAASFAAFRFLKAGYTTYWPRAERKSLEPLDLSGRTLPPLGRMKAH
jgi:glycosyltransferase involved in cell wall biosynthesis